MSDIVERAISPFNPATNTIQNRDKYNLFAPIASTNRIGMAGFNPTHFKVDEQIVSLDDDFVGLKDRMTTAEGDIDNLEGRVTITEGDISGLKSRVTITEGDISGLKSRVTTTEGDIDTLENRIGDVEDVVVDLQTDKLDKSTTAGFSAYTHNGATQVQTGISQNALNGFIVQRRTGGQITVPETPSNDTDATSKIYVDERDDAVKAEAKMYTDNSTVATLYTAAGYVEAEEERAIAAEVSLSQRIEAQEGLGGSLDAYDFGIATPTQQELTDYALLQIPSIEGDALKIWNGTRVTNLFDNNVWQLTNTQNTNPAIFEWANIGSALISRATNETLGLSKGGTVIPINSDGEYYTTAALIGAATAEQGQKADVALQTANDAVMRVIDATAAIKYIAVFGKNLFDKNAATIGYYVNQINGELNANEIYCASDYIPVNEQTSYTCLVPATTIRIAYYDNNKVFISGIYLPAFPITTPENVAFVRFSFEKIYIDNQQFEKGDISTWYEPYKYFLNPDAIKTNTLPGSGIVDNSIVPDKVSFLEIGKNLLDKNSLIEGYYISSVDGSVLPNADYFASDFIKIEASQNYTESHGTLIAFYDASQGFISGLGSSVIEVRTTMSPANAKYIRVSVKATVKDVYQLEKGDVKTEYEPFGYTFTPDILVADGSVTTEKIADGSVTTEKIADGVISARKTSFFDIEISPNLFNEDTVTDGYYLLADGGLSPNADYKTTDYIPISEGETLRYQFLYNGIQVDTASLPYYKMRFVLAYSADKTVIADSFASEQSTYITPANTAYVRVTIRNSENISNEVLLISDKAVVLPYSAYNSVVSQQIKSSVLKPVAVSPNQIDGVEYTGNLIPYGVLETKNGVYPNILNGYLNFNPNASYTSYKFKIDGAKTYFFTSTKWVVVCDVYGAVLFQPSTDVLSIDMSLYAGAYFVWFGSVASTPYFSYDSAKTEHQVEIAWLPEKPITDGSVTTEKIADGSVTVDKLAGDVLELIGAVDIPKVKFEKYSGEYTSRVTLGEYRNSIQKNVVINASANISGTVGEIVIGLSYLNSGNPADSVKVTIDGTNIKVWNYIFGTPSEVIQAHGLTIQNTVQISIAISDKSQIAVTLISNGVKYSKTDFNIVKRFCIVPYFEATNTTISNLSFSWTCKDIDKEIWCFGDSYFSYSNSRWLYYLTQDGYINNCLIDGYSGENSVNSYLSLENLIKMGKPKYIFWCLGMNDGSDSEETPSSAWLTKVQAVMALCDANGITPILATIPTVPTVNNEAKNAWVRNSGYQYVDFAKAVGADASGNWYPGMLYTDNVHPDIQGGIALYHQVLADFPQITITN